MVRQSHTDKIDRIVVYGHQLKVLTGTGTEKSASKYPRELYSRMLLIPDWDQERVASLKVAIIGLGGIGSVALQAVVQLGIGDAAELALVDHDVVEASNLSRVPYAYQTDVGKYKVNVAWRYVKAVRPHRKVSAIAEPCYAMEPQRQIANSDLILGCVDSELARACLNHLSASFMVPLLDMGAGVIVDSFAGERLVCSSGQARLFIPGVTPCLLCNMGIQYEDFDRDLLRLKMDENEERMLSRTGYLEDFLAEDAPQPSVYNLNAQVANAGVTFLLRYLLGAKITHHALHFNMETMTFEKIISKSQGCCPACGTDSILGTGELFDIESLLSEKEFPLPQFHTKKLENF